MTPEKEMICLRPDCTNRRSIKAKYCGSRCRKAAFKESHAFTSKVATVRKILNKAIREVDRAQTAPPARANGCGHFVGVCGVCTQKGCYGIPKK